MAKRHRVVVRAVLEVVNAANAIKPLGRRGYLTFGSFVFGWPTTEIASEIAAVSALDAWRRERRGDFASRSGQVSLVLTAVSWAALGVVHWWDARSRPHFEAGLRESLGPDFRSVAARSQPAMETHRRYGIWTTSLSRRRYVQKLGTVSYGPNGAANLADVWRRSDLPRDGHAPVLLQIPGGAWAIGMRRPQAYPLLSRLADRGWVCVSIAYRVSPKNCWPDHIVDVKRALAWIKDNIADYGGDPGNVAITGGSAGGHLAALAALTANDPQFQPGFEESDTSVVAAVPIYGRYDWTSTDGPGRRTFVEFLQRFVVKRPITEAPQIYLDASAIHRLRVGAPPFFVLHGTDDSIIPVVEARDFVSALRDVSAGPVAYSEIPHAQHMFDIIGSARGRYTAEAVECFLSWVHATRRARSGATEPVRNNPLTTGDG